MNERLWNWRLGAGFAAIVLAVIGYVSLFLRTRTVFWPSLTLLLAGALILLSGLRRAFREPQTYRGKIGGPVLAVFGLLICAAFAFTSYEVFRHFPAARNAPNIGQFAPQFTLPDSAGNPVSLSQLLAAPVADSSGSLRASKGVLVVFYRGYW